LVEIGVVEFAFAFHDFFVVRCDVVIFEVVEVVVAEGGSVADTLRQALVLSPRVLTESDVGVLETPCYNLVVLSFRHQHGGGFVVVSAFPSLYASDVADFGCRAVGAGGFEWVAGSLHTND
jgi:hypothetical protein